MKYSPISGYELFHKLLLSYYREGEDASTPQEEIEEFICILHNLYNKGSISGCIAWENEPVGFALWQIDTSDGMFYQRLGWGTILEIGVLPEFRGLGYGQQLVCYAEKAMQVKSYYICAYGKAEGFWKKCGYFDSGEIADNGLKVYVKQ